MNSAMNSAADDVVYETERCVVRNWRPSDAERVFDIYSRWEVARWLGSTPKAMEAREEADRLVERWGQVNRDEPKTGRWAVERKSDGVVAGTVILVPLSGGDGEYEVGWHFHPDSWGQGLATESALGALEWAYETLGLTEVFAVVRPGNEPSISVCRRLRMEYLGRTAQYYETELELFRVER
jgi:RimJ/RimL family protein N-acetyltransferase